MRFTKIPENTFKELIMNAGVFATNFDPTGTTPFDNDDILAATSGGVTFADSITYKDMGDGIANCPLNMKELKRVDQHEVSMSGEALTVTSTNLPIFMAHADAAAVSGTTGLTKIVPRNDLADADFKTVWWIGDYSDKNGETKGGFLAIKLMNALNGDGFSFESTDKDKGKFKFNFIGHYSMTAQTTVPYEIYLMEGAAETSV